MTVGALIGAYQEAEPGGLRALLPLAGRTLLEYQVRCAAAAGAAPIVVVVERVPQALQDALERLRLDRINVFAVSDVQEAVSRFETGSMILVIGDGIAPPAALVAMLAEEAEPVIATVPDDEAHHAFERIDAKARWAGVAIVDSNLLGSTAAMLGDWDLQSTLLRRTLQDGASRLAIEPNSGEPLLIEKPEQLHELQQALIASSRVARTDWASRYILPWVEEIATRQLLETAVRPRWLMWGALALTLGAALAFSQGFLWLGLALLVISAPLDLIAMRIAALRLRPLPIRMLSRLAIWPAAGVALIALGWWVSRDQVGWGALMAAAAAAAFAEAARLEQGGTDVPGETWLLSRRNAIFAALPFAAAGAWSAYLVALAVYAAASFFYAQHVRHIRSS